ncbi:tetratricopeptide repeat protein [Clostridia bacterium OttesenSCG-928-O13]|nr:tetratricopeptide repeat protein [Clostridia bacterium OttesenSCG-928-O13]
MKKTLSILLAAALLLGLFCACGEKQPDVAELLSLGQRYLDNEEYEDALEVFLQVIDIDPQQIDAYLGAADAYLALDEPEEAMAILEEGLDATDSRRIERQMERIVEQQDALSGDAAPTGSPDGSSAGPAASSASDSSPAPNSTGLAFATHTIPRGGQTLEIQLPEGIWLDANYDMYEDSAILPESILQYTPGGKRKVGGFWAFTALENFEYDGTAVRTPGEESISYGNGWYPVAENTEPRAGGAVIIDGKYLLMTTTLPDYTVDTPTTLHCTDVFILDGPLASRFSATGLFTLFHNIDSAGTLDLISYMLGTITLS